MTTIAFRDGVLAADRLITSSDTVHAYKTKIHKINGALVGSVGNLALCDAFVRWVADGCPEDMPELCIKDADDDAYNASGFIIRPTGVTTYSAAGWAEYELSRLAWGSGADFARGALSMGASAEQAVRAAIEWDGGTGGDIDTLRFDA